MTNSDFIIIHRIAISEKYNVKRLSKNIINFIADLAIKINIYSTKVNINHDNFAMMKIFEKSYFTFCGVVHFRRSLRRAYEKVLE